MSCFPFRKVTIIGAFDTQNNGVPDPMTKTERG